jgi:prophage DNA circulation protein
MNGAGYLLKAMGFGDIDLDQVIAMANQLATSGALEKVLAFADDLQENNRLLRELVNEQRIARGVEPISITSSNTGFGDAGEQRRISDATIEGRAANG